MADRELAGGHSKGTLSKRMALVRGVHRATGSPRHSVSHGRVRTGPEGRLIGERPLPGGEAGPEGTEYYFSARWPRTRRWSGWRPWRTAVGPSSNSTRTPRANAGSRTTRGGRWDGLHRHLSLVMLAYSFLVLSSTVVAVEATSSRGPFSPSTSRRTTTLPAVHRRILMWLLEDLVMWFVETDRIKDFRPRRNEQSSISPKGC